MTFWRVTLPLAWPARHLQPALCFIISFDEFVMAFFLSGTEPTLPVFLFGQLRFPNKLPGVLALGSLILLVSTILVVAAELLRRRGVQERPDMMTAPMADTIISLKDVRRDFGPVAAVDGVSFDIAARRVLLLLGPSGCGKTTLLRMLAGLRSADRRCDLASMASPWPACLPIAGPPTWCSRAMRSSRT